MEGDITKPMENAKDILMKTGKLAVKATPKAHQDRLDGLIHDENGAPVLKLRVRAVAADGQANAAVLALLADAFDLPKSSLSIIRGETSRHKVIAYAGT